jgi:hypothetical protein
MRDVQIGDRYLQLSTKQSGTVVENRIVDGVPEARPRDVGFATASGGDAIVVRERRWPLKWDHGAVSEAALVLLDEDGLPTENPDWRFIGR